jgi:hypothetical protein
MARAGRGSLVAAVGLCTIAVLVAFVAGNRGQDGLAVVARNERGVELVRLALPPDGRFTLAYKNSLYRAAAEERFAATGEETFALVELASDSVAVLEEYYGLAGKPVESGTSEERRYRYRLPAPREFRELRVVATELGQRTIVVGSRRAELWRLTPDGDVVVIAVEPGE